jgi:hypothetical protein
MSRILLSAVIAIASASAASASDMCLEYQGAAYFSCQMRQIDDAWYQFKLDMDHLNTPQGGPTNNTGPSTEERAAHEAQWIAECKPKIVTGKDGIRRYVYAKAGCDMQLLSH